MNKCAYAKLCGGCQLQDISYKEQLTYKQNEVEKLLSRFCKVKPILGMSNPYNYRNKVQVSFGKDEHGNVIYGNYVTSTHMIVPVKDCLICDDNANKIIDSIAKIIIKHHVSIFNENTYKGCLRHVLIRCTTNNEYMVVLVTGTNRINNIDLVIKDILKFNPNVKTIVQNINNRRTSMILGSKNIVLYGNGYIVDSLCGLKFSISASSFYQVNKVQTEVLYNEAIKACKLKSNEVLLDAYCGTGTIGLVASKYVKEVIGVELNKSAIKDAINNMKANNIINETFVCDDAGKFMERLVKSKQKVDVVIMDPPRTGSDYKFLSSLVKLNPSKVVYVSCNPNTLRDDLRYLTKYYVVDSIQPVDMFAFTKHVECVVAMHRKNV